MGTAATFVAVQVGTHEDDGFVVVGVTNVDNTEYMTFQRSLPIGGDEDWGVHIELSDQSNSGYELVKRCVLTRNSLDVGLVKPLGPGDEYTSVHIELRLTDADWQPLRDGLRRVFAEREPLLVVAG